MIKLNETSASINVLAESELDQVVGGYCHKGGGHKRWGYGHGHCGQRDYDKRGGQRDYEGRGYDDSSEYDRPESRNDSGDVNNQVIQLDITINQVAV